MLYLLYRRSASTATDASRHTSPSGQELNALRSVISYCRFSSMTSTNADQTGPKIQRYSLALPTRVEVKIDRKHSWNEMTRLEDISAFGAAFNLKRPVKRGRLLLISLPMPRQLRCYDYLEPQYRVWAVVRRCIGIAASDDSRGYAVGIAFVGKNPPQGYVDNPAKLYDLATR